MYRFIIFLSTLIGVSYCATHNALNYPGLWNIYNTVQDNDTILMGSFPIDTFRFYLPPNMFFWLKPYMPHLENSYAQLNHHPDAPDFDITRGMDMDRMYFYNQAHESKYINVINSTLVAVDCRWVNVGLRLFDGSLVLQDNLVYDFNNSKQIPVIDIVHGEATLDNVKFTNNNFPLLVRSYGVTINGGYFNNSEHQIGIIVIHEDTIMTNVYINNHIILLYNGTLNMLNNGEYDGIYSIQDETIQNLSVQERYYIMGESNWIIDRSELSSVNFILPTMTISGGSHIGNITVDNLTIILSSQEIVIEGGLVNKMHTICSPGDIIPLMILNELLIEEHIVDDSCHTGSNDPPVDQNTNVNNPSIILMDDNIMIIIVIGGIILVIGGITFGLLFFIFNKKRPKKEIIQSRVIVSKDQFDIIREIGRGSQGIVYLARHNGAEVALKISEHNSDALLAECTMLASIPPHPNVIRVLGFNTNPLLLEMEYIDGMSLLEYRRKMTEIKYCWIAREIARGMVHLSTYEIVHRDLALRNILISTDGTQVKISDFGLARRIIGDQGQTGSLKGVPIPWMAPECLKERIYSEKSDVWAYGITLWEFFTGQQPFEEFGDDFLSLGNQIVMGLYPNLQHKLLPINIRPFLHHCFSADPESRPSFKEIVEFLTELC